MKIFPRLSGGRDWPLTLPPQCCGLLLITPSGAKTGLYRRDVQRRAAHSHRHVPPTHLRHPHCSGPLGPGRRTWEAQQIGQGPLTFGCGIRGRHCKSMHLKSTGRKPLQPLQRHSPFLPLMFTRHLLFSFDVATCTVNQTDWPRVEMTEVEDWSRTSEAPAALHLHVRFCEGGRLPSGRACCILMICTS